MQAKIVDGRKLADKYLDGIRRYISKHGVRPKLATILVGDNEASETYIKIKKRKCKSVGIDVDVHRLGPEKREIFRLIENLNRDDSVNGILVQLPLPAGISQQEVINKINVIKDVDGLHPLNIGRLSYGDETMPACTPHGIIKMLEHESVKIRGSKVVILGRGIHVGRPLFSMLVNRDATVTLCHSKTTDLTDLTKEADIIVVAIGKPSVINGGMIKSGAVIIDVGINKLGGKITGDVDFESVKNKAGIITPVPGGVGPMTVAMLAMNIINAYKMQRGGYEKRRNKKNNSAKN